MKKRILSFLLVLVMAIGFLPTIAFADVLATSGTCGENVTWDFDESTGTLTISGTGDMCDLIDFPPAISSALSSTVKTIQILDGVTSIGQDMFAHYDKLTLVTIPLSVTSITYGAFWRSDNITDVYYGGNRYQYYNLGGIPNTDNIHCAQTKYSYPIGDNLIGTINETTGKLIISGTGDMPNEDMGFSTVVPYYLTNIIKTVEIENGVTSIGGYAFFGCKSLASVTIPNTVSFINTEAFSYCSSITSITIPDSVTLIGSGAFADCTSLDTVHITDIEKWKKISFGSSSSNPLNNDAKLVLNGNEVTNLVIYDGVTKINNYAFNGCSSIVSVTIPASVKEIGKNAFYNCTGITDVYYGSTRDDFVKIAIGEGNTQLAFANIHYTDPHAHSYTNACDTTCNGCDFTREITHTYGAYVSDNNATTEADGTKTRVCSGCGYKETVTDVGSKLPTVTPTPDPAPSPTPEEKPVEIIDTTKVFTDVKANKWYTNAVNYAYSHSFIAGVSATEFGRDVSVTRGMFITILARIAGVDTSKAANKVETKFTDVKSGKYYTAAIKWASENNIVSGLSDTDFGPEASIERQQLCTMIVNFAKFMKVDLTASQAEIAFADGGNIRKYAKTAVKACQMAGIVSGYASDGGTEFKPLNTATRAEAAQILYKFHKDFVVK